MGVEVGQSLGSYRIERRLGRGGMGEVFAAHDSRLDRQVALKVLLAEVADDPERLERFEREAKAVAALDHPSIVTIFSVESVGETRFLTMELVEGSPLAERIPAGGLSLDDLFSIALPLTDAVAAAHSRGIVHRDLKPGNIMVGNDGRVRVLDFGLAKLLPTGDSDDELTSAPTARPETQEGVALGTVGYMSPEQVRGRPADPRSDVFSLGVVLFEMAVGQRPFQAESAPDVLSAILRDTPTAVDTLRTGLPHHLGRIIRRCLEKDPGRRYASAREVHTELEDLANELRTERILEEHGSAITPVRKRRGKPHGLMVGGAVVTALVIGLILLLPQWTADNDRPPGPSIESLAVLPFDNLMNDAEQDYFVDGIHEALITDLAKLGALRVISRTSAMRYKNSDLALPAIARELGVDALIEGSVLRADGQVRVTAQLIDGATDENLWADSYDRELENVLALLSDVARAIATEIEVAVTPEQQQRLAVTDSVDPEAYELFLRARHHFNRGNFAGFREALPLYTRAVELDPDFAQGWAYLSITYMVHGFFRVSPPEEMIPKARATAERALSLDDSLGGAHSSLGYIALFFDWDWPTAKHKLELGIELDPTNMLAHHAYADYLGVMGECDRSVEQVRKGRQYDPMGVWSNLFVMGHLTYCGYYEEAIEEGRRILEAEIDTANIRTYIAESLWQLGRYDEALEEWRQAWGAQSSGVQAYETGYAQGGPRGALLARAEELATTAQSRPVNPFVVACTYGAAGEADAAFEWLDRAYEQRTPQLLHLVFHPRLDPIRDDPRFADLLRRIGIPE
jgi:serine/threonine-protein kinase